MQITEHAAAGTSVAAGTFDVTQYGAIHDGTTDDTAAIQAAIDAAVAAGGGIVYFPPGIYQLTAAQTSGTSNGFTYSGQLLLPARALTSGRITVVFRGPIQAPMLQWGPQGSAGSEPAHTTGAILRSTATSGAALDVKSASPPIAGSPFSNIELVVENLTVRLPNQPTATGIRAVAAASLKVEGVSVDVNAAAASISQPDVNTAASIGIYAPGSNNAAHVSIKNSQCIGFGRGLRHAEHTVLDNFAAQLCAIGIQPDAGANHLSNYNRVLLCANIKHIVPGGAHYLAGSIDVESPTTGWYATTVDIDDGNNYLTGQLDWHHVQSGVGVNSTFNVTGASKLRLREIRFLATSLDRPLDFASYAAGSKTNINANVGASMIDVRTTELAVAFVGPASGYVLVKLSAVCISGGTADYFWGIRDGSGDVANSQQFVCYQENYNRVQTTKRIAVTPGTTYNWKWGHRTPSGAQGIQTGPDMDATMEVWAA